MDRLTVLALRAKAGDRNSLEAFVTAVHPDVLRTCRYLGFPSDPEDLTQETMERVLRSLHLFRGSGAARAWVLTIARRVCIDSTRRSIRERKLTERHNAERADHHQDDSWLEIEDLLTPLDTDRREAFVLTQLLGLSYEQAAEILECPIGTIRSRVARARQQLLSDKGVASAVGA